MAKLFQIEELAFTPTMVAGEEPWETISHDPIGDYVEADTAEEAVDLALDWLGEHIESQYEFVANDDRTGYDIMLDGELFRRCELTAKEFSK